MSISRSDWEKTFNQIRARLAHTVPPVRYPVVGPSVIGVKAGLSLVALSPAATAPEIWKGEKAYGDDAVAIVGTGIIKKGTAIASQVAEVNTVSTSYTQLLTATGDYSGKIIVAELNDFKHSQVHDPVKLELKEGAVQKDEMLVKCATSYLTPPARGFLIFAVAWGTGSQTYVVNWKVDAGTGYGRTMYMYAYQLGA